LVQLVVGAHGMEARSPEAYVTLSWSWVSMPEESGWLVYYPYDSIRQDEVIGTVAVECKGNLSAPASAALFASLIVLCLAIRLLVKMGTCTSVTPEMHHPLSTRSVK
jgi:hypothetical protein